MPVTFTPEEQAKVDEHLKELGYDGHAKDVIAKTNAEAKANREKAEAAETARKTAAEKADALEKADAQRQADAKKKADDLAAEQKKIEDAKKSTEERIAATEKEVAETVAAAKRELEEERKARAKERDDEKKERESERKAQEAKDVQKAVRDAAKDAGIIDPVIIGLLDLSGIKVVDGDPDVEAITALIEAHAKEKPHLYKGQAERDRDDRGRYQRPDPTGRKGEVDAATLSDADFDALTARLRTGRT